MITTAYHGLLASLENFGAYGFRSTGILTLLEPAIQTSNDDFGFETDVFLVDHASVVSMNYAADSSDAAYTQQQGYEIGGDGGVAFGVNGGYTYLTYQPLNEWFRLKVWVLNGVLKIYVNGDEIYATPFGYFNVPVTARGRLVISGFSRLGALNHDIFPIKNKMSRFTAYWDGQVQVDYRYDERNGTTLVDSSIFERHLLNQLIDTRTAGPITQP